MGYLDLITEIENQIDKAYDDCNFDALDYLHYLLNYVKALKTK